MYIYVHTMCRIVLCIYIYVYIEPISWKLSDVYTTIPYCLSPGNSSDVPIAGIIRASMVFPAGIVYWKKSIHREREKMRERGIHIYIYIYKSCLLVVCRRVFAILCQIRSVLFVAQSNNKFSIWTPC